jgi:sulfur carrier protein
MMIVVNDVPRPTTARTVADLLRELAVPRRGVAVAVNGDVVRRVDWSICPVASGDRVEILTAAQGG